MEPRTPYMGRLVSLPGNWTVVPLRLLAEDSPNSFVDGPFGSDLKNEEYQDSGIPLIQLNNIGIGKHLVQNTRYISEEKADTLARHIAYPNDVVIAKMADPVARAALVAPDFDKYVIVADCVRLATRKDHVDNSFLVYAINSDSFRYSAELVASGTTRLRVNLGDIKRLRIWLPPLSEQRAIADFLDRETAKIDTLIDRKRRLLDLLVERRQALITRAVTKGLDPDVPMKDSGVEWLGEIPGDWDVESARWLFTEVDDRSETGDEELLSVSHITGVTSRAEKEVNMFMAESLEGYKTCREGDLVINTLWAWMGAMGVAFQSGIVSPAYNVYRPSESFDPRFLDFLIRVPILAQEVTRYSKGVWSSRLRLYPEGFYKVSLPVPSRPEQDRIVNQLAIELNHLDDVARKAGELIALLEERRKTLIDEVVTGRLRVM